MGRAEYNSLTGVGPIGAIDDPDDDESTGAILHVVGRVTASVQTFLGPMTHALLEAGKPQILVLLDAPDSKAYLAYFEHRVRLVAVPMQKSGWCHWMALFSAVREQMRTHRIAAVHFHGLKPWIVAAGLARQRDRRTAIYLSPHGSRMVGLLRWVAPIASIAMKSPARRPGYVASSLSEAFQMSISGVEPVLVEGAVSEAFFAVRRHETRTPLIVAGNHRDARRGVELTSRLAVVLGAAEWRLAFNWFGPIGPESTARLTAANVGTFGTLAEEELASRLAAGWVFIAPGGDSHFPVLLVQAMAVGLACIVADTPTHRAIIEHELTGLIYSTEAEAQSHLTRIVDSPDLRRRLGNAARETAAQRFSVDRFRDVLIPLYWPADRAESSGPP